MPLVPTGEMTLGPFFPREFGQGANDLTQLDGRAAEGEIIELTGRVVQGDGRPVDNLIVEIWQADPRGRYDNAAFLGWGRATTDAQGRYAFRTIMPGAPAGRAPHINFCLLYSGLMRQLQTVMFFSDARDPVLDAVRRLEKKRLLIAGSEKKNMFRFDIRLQGGEETPFFDD